MYTTDRGNVSVGVYAYMLKSKEKLCCPLYWGKALKQVIFNRKRVKNTVQTERYFGFWLLFILSCFIIQHFQTYILNYKMNKLEFEK